VKPGRQEHWKVLLAEGEQRALLKQGFAGRQGLSETVHSMPVQFGGQAQRLLLLRKGLIEYCAAVMVVGFVLIIGKICL